MVSCSVLGCKSRFGQKDIKFHRFPVKRLQLWGRIVNRENFTATKNSRICSKHFVSGYPGWEPSDPDWVPTLNLPKSNNIPQVAIKIPHQRIIGSDYRSRSMGENQGQFSHVNIGFHNYMRDSHETVIPDKNELPVIIACETLTKVKVEIPSDDESELIVPTLCTNLPQEENCSPSQGTLEHNNLEAENRNLQLKISKLEETLKQRTWSAEKLKDNNEMTRYYTGLPDYRTFLYLYRILEDKAREMVFTRGNTKQTLNSFEVPIIDQFLAVMTRLKISLFPDDIAQLFNIQKSAFTSMFQMWIKLMEMVLKDMFPFPIKPLVEKYIPECYTTFPNLQIILDCTKSNAAASTLLICLTPDGAISILPKNWSRRVSGNRVLKDRNLILLLDEFNNVDEEGFYVEELLNDKNWTINLPESSEIQISYTRSISELRLLLEEAIRRVDKFRIFDEVMMPTIGKLAPNVFAVCSYISNVCEPLL